MKLTKSSKSNFSKYCALRAFHRQASWLAIALLLPAHLNAQPTVSSSSTANVATSLRPQLAISQPLTSFSDVAPSDPIWQNGINGGEHYARSAAQSLLERFGVVGVTYADKTIRPDLPITTEEAAVLVKSSFDKLLGLEPAIIDSLIQSNQLNEMAGRTVRLQIPVLVRQRTLPQGPCRGASAPNPRFEDIGLGRASAASINRLVAVYGQSGWASTERRFDLNRPVTWGLARTCLPKGTSGSFSMFSYALKRAAAEQETMTRGDFMVVLERQIQEVYGELTAITLQDLPGFQARDARPSEIATSRNRLNFFAANPASYGRLTPTNVPQRSSFISADGRVRLEDVAASSQLSTSTMTFALVPRPRTALAHYVNLVTTRSLGTDFAAIATAVRRNPLPNYQSYLGRQSSDRREIYRGWSALRGQTGKAPFPVGVFHFETAFPVRPGQTPVIKREVYAMIETPSGLIVHYVESPNITATNSNFSFQVLELYALSVGLGMPTFTKVAPVVSIAP